MKTTYAALSVLVCASVATAQGMPGPAKELKKLERMVGSWEGSGTWAQGPGLPEGKWTSTDNTRWVLDGHFLRSDTKIVGDNMPGAMQFTSFTGWDRENGKYMQYSVGNNGVLQTAEMHWTSDDEFLSYNIGAMGPMTTVDRWVTKLGDGSMEFVGHQAQGAGEFFVHVKGMAKRVSKEPADAQIEDASFMADMTGATAKMRKLEGMAADYAVKGWVVPGPGMPKMEFTANETATMLFGGSILHFHMVGDPTETFPMKYEHDMFMAWDGQNSCYASMGFNNLGEVFTDECRMAGKNKLIMTNAGLRHGQPTVGRHVFELDDNGNITAVTGDMMIADGEPTRSFESTYEKKN